MESLSVFSFQKRGIHLSFDIDVLDPTVAPATGSLNSPRHYPLIPLIFLARLNVFFYKNKISQEIICACNADTDPEARKFAKYTNKPDFRPFKKAFAPTLVCFCDLLHT